MGNPYWLKMLESMISISAVTTVTVGTGSTLSLLGQPMKIARIRKGIILRNVFMVISGDRGYRVVW
jgi:hypothetical protein